MQSTNIGSRGNLSKSLHDVAESARETTEHLNTEATRLASETVETANEYYNKSRKWLQKNYGKTLGLMGIMAAIGAIGYILGSKSEKSQF